MDLHCLAVHQNTNKRSSEYAGGEKCLAEKAAFCHLLSLKTLDKHSQRRKTSLELVYSQSNIGFIVVHLLYAMANNWQESWFIACQRTPLHACNNLGMGWDWVEDVCSSKMCVIPKSFH